MIATSHDPKDVPSLWRPLRAPTFRNLLVADVVSDMGTFMQSVGAAWLMVSLHAGALYVALTQTASALPFFVFALPAGAIGDIVDRRKLILFTEIWMAGIAIMLAVLTSGGLMSPLLLLILTFALSAGDAFESPTWRAVLPELVSKEDLASASALNGIEFNLARAVGPALAGVVIAACSRDSICHQCGILLGSHRGGGALATAPPKTHGATRDPWRRDSGGDPLCAVFTVDSHCAVSVRCRNILRQRAPGIAAFRRPCN